MKNNSTCACVHRGRGQTEINIQKLEFSNLVLKDFEYLNEIVPIDHFSFPTIQ